MPTTRANDVCQVCGDRVPRPTRGELLKLLSELHGELRDLPVPGTITEEDKAGKFAFRLGHAMGRIKIALEQEHSKLCPFHAKHGRLT